MNDTAFTAARTSSRRERFGLRLFRPPPGRALIFGAVYGAVAGAVIAWDLAVLIRLGRLASARVSEEFGRRRHGPDVPD
jgi:hypothetical protein